MEYSSIFVCLMGMGTVFFGLICLIALTYLMSAVVGRGKKAAPAPVPAAPQTAGEVTPELVAAVSAALAEELGTDITGIRIVSRTSPSLRRTCCLWPCSPRWPPSS